MIFLLDLWFEKTKINQNKWILDRKLNKATLDLFKKIQYYKKYIWIDWSFNLTLILATAILWYIDDIILKSYFLAHDIFAPIIIFTAPLWWLIFLTLFLHKINKFKKEIIKHQIFDWENIEKLKKEEKIKLDENGVNFAFVGKKIFSKKAKIFVISEKMIKYFLGKEAKSIMYIYVYDISNYKATYFVYDNQKIIENYKEIQW
ncbi:hypothetical protein NPA08_03855 [Mycoplasmopsis citelli]|uniref:hypothetical protein n=1 Tax=Mycoplasmopsis citelli TaxID=171281 RepID=UPI002114C69D|nr:hypothetical protein [Mycoplasmopsis citelli]UUD36061.1 hypothetical protein NPA08_03855 [Mycoplasmopsis citelli]